MKNQINIIEIEFKKLVEAMALTIAETKRLWGSKTDITDYEKGGFLMILNVTFSEIELASDVKTFVSFDSGSCDAKIKDTIFSAEDDDFLKVTKEIASPLKIISVEKVTEDLLNKAL